MESELILTLLNRVACFVVIAILDKEPLLEMCLSNYNDTMMTSSNRDIFRVTGPLWGEFVGHTGEFPS